MRVGSDYLDNAILAHVLKGVTLTPLSAVYLGLHAYAPVTYTTSAWAATELTSTYSNYHRTMITGSAWGTATGGTLTSASVINFPVAGGPWGIVSYFSIWDAVTAGNLLFVSGFTVPQRIGSGDILSFPAGTLEIKLL